MFAVRREKRVSEVLWEWDDGVQIEATAVAEERGGSSVGVAEVRGK